MFRRNLFTIVTTLALAAFVWYGVNVYPLGREQVDIISTQGAPQKIITINPGDTVSQVFRPTQYLASSFSIFSVDDKMSGQKITATITDLSGNLLATSKSTQPSYHDEKLKLTFPIDWLETNTDQGLTINIHLDSGSPLQLLTLKENIYKKGVFTFNNEVADDLDLSLSSTQPAFASPDTKKGVVAGLIVLLGTLIIQLIPPSLGRWRWISAGLLLIIITPLALGGFWQSQELLGINDWDFYFSVHEVLRHSVVTDHSFPFWNPYICGGTAGLGDPEFPLFTLTFLLELIFGIPLGIRLAIFLSTAIGALGMLALGKRLGLSVNAALLAALIAFFGTVNLLEIVEGHPNIFAAMWIPWIFWAWLAAYRKRSGKWPLICGIFLALTFFQGGIYLLMYTTLAFLLLPFLVSRPRNAIIITIKAGLWALGLAAIKLVPVLFWLSQFQDQAYASATITLPYLYEIFLGRHLHGVNILPNQETGWHEYGAYIGPIALALSLFSLTTIRRSRITRGLVIAAILAILLSSAGPLLKPAFDLMPFFPRSSISRFILFAVIPIALLAGLGLNSIKQKTIKILIIGIVAVDLMSLSYPLSQQAFVIPQNDVQIKAAPSPIAFTKNTYEKRLNNIDYTRSYLPTLAGYGTLNYCTPLSPQVSVITVEEKEKDSNIITTADSSKGTVQLTAWSPNTIQIKADIIQKTELFINTNYAKGWKMNGQPAEGEARQWRPAKELFNRVGATLNSGTYNLTFRYRSPGFILGLIITLTTLMLIPYFRFVRRK